MSSDDWLYGWGLGHASVGAASLAVPLYAIALGASAFEVGLIASTAAVAGVPGAIVWGRVAARTGRRRRFVLIALGATAGVLATLPLVNTALGVLLANVALLFVVGAAAPVLNLIVVDGYDAADWNDRFGVLAHYQGVGWLGGLLVGAVWAAVVPRYLGTIGSQRAFFLLLAVVAVVGFLVVLARYPEAPTVSERRFRRRYADLPRTGRNAARFVCTVPFGPGRIYWALRTIDPAGVRDRLTPRLVRYLLGATLFFLGFAAFFGPLPALLTDAGFTTEETFLLYVLSSAGAAACYARVGDWAARVGVDRLQTGALAVRAVAFPIVAVVVAAVPATLAPTLGLAVVGTLLALVGVTWAVISVTATGTVSRLSPDPVRGEALGAYTALAGVGGGVGAVVGGAVATAVGYLAAFGVAGALVVTGAVVAATTR